MFHRYTTGFVLGWAIVLLAIPVSVLIGITDAKFGQDPSGIGATFSLLLVGCGGIAIGGFILSACKIPDYYSKQLKTLIRIIPWILLIITFAALISPIGDRLLDWIESFA